MVYVILPHSLLLLLFCCLFYFCCGIHALLFRQLSFYANVQLNGVCFVWIDKNTHTTYMHKWRPRAKTKRLERYFFANWTRTQSNSYLFLLIRGLFGATVSVIVVTSFCWGLHLWTLFIQYTSDNCSNGFPVSPLSLSLISYTYYFYTQNAINAFFFRCKYLYLWICLLIAIC